jgi:protein SCO1/2
VKFALACCVAVLMLAMNWIGVQAVAHNIGQKTIERRTVVIPINDFVLVDQNSREFRFSTLTGRVVIVAFAYTTCPDVCPLITAALRIVQSGLTADERGKVFLLTITTDPEIDSPKVLSGYGKRFSADSFNWSFLTGDQAVLARVWKNFGVGVKRKARGLVDHTPLTAIIDRHGQMRVAYIGAAPDAKMMLQDVRSLLKQE